MDTNSGIIDAAVMSFTKRLSPLICIVIPRRAEKLLFISVSETHSERYVVRLVTEQTFLDSGRNDALMKEIREVFNLDSGIRISDAGQTDVQV